MHYLEFERPIAELEGKIVELRKLAEEDPSMDIDTEVARLQSRAGTLVADTYARLTPWQKVQVARHPGRPHFLDYARRLLEDFTPLAGDRSFGEDQAVVAGLARPFTDPSHKLRVLVECDTGMGRCGVQTPWAAVELAQQIAAAPGLHFTGLMTYPAAGKVAENEDFLELERNTCTSLMRRREHSVPRRPRSSTCVASCETSLSSCQSPSCSGWKKCISSCA